jgi:hypothetical protein
MLPPPPALLSSTVRCPKCSGVVELDDQERASGSFICPVCRRVVQDLLIYWELSAQEWRRFGSAHTVRMVMIGILMLVAGGAGMWIGDLLGAEISLLFGLVFIVGGGMLVASIWSYIKYRHAPGRVYVYVDSVTCAYDYAKWQIPALHPERGSGATLVSVAIDHSGIFPVMTFVCGAAIRDKTSVPIPDSRMHEAVEVHDYFQELLAYGYEV